MNVKEYIRSGIVESYVLGMATDAERMEFEQQCASYPEIVEARDSFERALELELMRSAAKPPVALREKILMQIAPVLTNDYVNEEPAETPVRGMNVWRLMAAACFLAVLGVGYWAYITNEKYNDALAKQSSVQQQLEQKNKELAAINDDMDMLHQPGVKMAALKGTPMAPQALTTVYWDSASKDVYLLVNNLPQAATDKQYQLWALLDGKPIDLGMLEVKEKRLLVKMKNVQAAQAFAITLEDKGSSLSAPKGQMYVVGNL